MARSTKGSGKGRSKKSKRTTRRKKPSINARRAKAIQRWLGPFYRWLGDKALLISPTYKERVAAAGVGVTLDMKREIFKGIELEVTGSLAADIGRWKAQTEAARKRSRLEMEVGQ